MTVYADRERNGSDVRVIRYYNTVACVDCTLLGGPRRLPGDTFRTDEIPTMLDHLDLHMVLGDHVPPAAFTRLRTEHADNFERGPR
ncbi:hypothetical protein P3H15_32770 [Rhodococcus sp. T2V]|uniref:hypothetical protein n=1 Tax=Rhodococcus sp. T2V TaxID=3034164 RepID=UPI0023E317F9|nr:hypothetical protein [Rhodococcus sp. T2V]MDF3309794.1 hypothetical protein [Rhodococcus sp. T2V]